MLKGERDMKYLRINDGKVEYTIDNLTWKNIDEIDKTELLYLTTIAVEQDFEMDEFVKENIHNQAHQIIYKNIYEKFKGLLENKNRFKDESEALFKDAVEKYKVATDN